MAVRILTYVGLLYQDLIHTKQLDSQGRLPPVLPIVLYNGGSRWDATQDLAALVEPNCPLGFNRGCSRRHRNSSSAGASSCWRSTRSTRCSRVSERRAQLGYVLHFEFDVTPSESAGSRSPDRPIKCAGSQRCRSPLG